MAQLRTGTVTVTTAGTRVQLPTVDRVSCHWIQFQANDGNSGNVVVGGANVVAAQATRQGTMINEVSAVEREPVEFRGPIDLSEFWVDATQNGDKLHYSYLVGPEQ